ncbi:homeobox protein CDX-1-like [Artemia franciscana]|uniref:Homeobox domain-containing protein n=2 Tax=Artemia franciscana TaxID=6661 RepID=A0AA88LBI9_ARTSF|nr:hypothetical protein QYM36_010088 [Artemia franciscana]
MSMYDGMGMFPAHTSSSLSHQHTAAMLAARQGASNMTHPYLYPRDYGYPQHFVNVNPGMEHIIPEYQQGFVFPPNPEWHQNHFQPCYRQQTYEQEWNGDGHSQGAPTPDSSPGGLQIAHSSPQEHYQYAQKFLQQIPHNDSVTVTVVNNQPGLNHGTPDSGVTASDGISSIASPSMMQRPLSIRSPYEWMKKQSFHCNMPPGSKTRTKDKYRVVYTDHQRLELEKEFHYNKYITIRRKSELATVLGLSERQVKIWFQNRRAKDRKQMKKREEVTVKEKIDPMSYHPIQSMPVMPMGLGMVEKQELPEPVLQQQDQ